MLTLLEGHLGEAFADDLRAPRVAELCFAGVHFFGGDAAHPLARAIVDRLPVDQVVTACTPPWRALLDATYGPRLMALPATDYDARSLDPEPLRQLASQVPVGYDVRRIDLELACRVETELQTEDHVHFFGSPECFIQRGVGFCALHEGRIASAASSGAFHDAGIEVQINTLPQHRGRGLAKRLMETILARPDLASVRRIALRTRDAHGLYRGYGFAGLAQVETWMERPGPSAAPPERA